MIIGQILSDPAGGKRTTGERLADPADPPKRNAPYFWQMRFLVVLFVSLISTTYLFGQWSATLPDSAPLQTTDSLREGQVYLSYRVVDSTQLIHVFLHNRTTDSLVLGLDERVLPLETEGRDSTGGWVQLDRHYPELLDCGNGPIFQIPARHYAWRTYRQFDGDVETEIRFRYVHRGDTLRTAPVRARVDPSRFYTAAENARVRLEWLLNRPHFSLEEREVHMLRVARTMYREGDREAARQFIRAMQVRYPGMEKLERLLRSGDREDNP